MHFSIPPIALAAVAVALALPVSAEAHDGAHDALLGVHGDTGTELRAPVQQAVAHRRLTEVRTVGLDAGLPVTWCGTERPTDDLEHAAHPGKATIKVVYARAAGAPNRFAVHATPLQATAALITGVVAGETGGRRTLRFDLGTSCGSSYLDIASVTLPRPASAYFDAGGRSNFGLLSGDVKAALRLPAGSPARNLLVYADGLRGAGGVLGTATTYIGPQASLPGPGSVHDLGGLVATIWGPASAPAGLGALDPPTALHEVFHNLGAVQDSTPHSSGAGHCVDEWDVMCYDDNGPNMPLSVQCSLRAGVINELLDCGRDDYFSADPAAGSWLDSHWNVYDSSFLGSCDSELAVACALPAVTVAPQPKPEPAGPSDVAPPAAGGDPAADSARLVLRRVRGHHKTVGRVDVTTASGKLVFKLRRVRLPRGRWSVKACSLASAQRPCTVKRVRVHKSATTLTLKVPAPAGSILARLDVDRLAGRRFASTASR